MTVVSIVVPLAFLSITVVSMTVYSTDATGIAVALEYTLNPLRLERHGDVPCGAAAGCGRLVAVSLAVAGRFVETLLCYWLCILLVSTMEQNAVCE